MGVEITVSGKLRGERAHFEKHTAGIIPKSGKVAEEVVRSSTNSLLTKMGLVGIKLKISLKEEIHSEFDLVTESQPKGEVEIPTESEDESQKKNQSESESQTNNEELPADSEIMTESKDIINNEVKEIAVNKSET